MGKVVISSKKDIRRETIEQLEEFFTSNGEKKFRARQVMEWLWKKGITDFGEMSNISLDTREILSSKYTISPVSIDYSQISNDRTIKVSFRLFDGNLVEGVLIPTDTRMTACISSQVGCSLSCKFCATGFMDRKRNIEAPEIYDQVKLLNDLSIEHYQKPLTNIVYMGMGEPLLNYSNVLKSTDLVTSENGMNWSPKRITVSTAGIEKMIRKLGDDKARFNLALSLHAANDEKRNKIMPINETNSLESLLGALSYYYQATKNEVTYEYILFKDFNDSIEDAKELIQFARKVPGKVNLIEYNPVENTDFKKPTYEATEKFKNHLLKHRVNARVRRSRGKDIDAACGQLANKRT